MYFSEGTGKLNVTWEPGRLALATCPRPGQQPPSPTRWHQCRGISTGQSLVGGFDWTWIWKGAGKVTAPGFTKRKRAGELTEIQTRSLSPHTRRGSFHGSITRPYQDFEVQVRTQYRMRPLLWFHTNDDDGRRDRRTVLERPGSPGPTTTAFSASGC